MKCGMTVCYIETIRNVIAISNLIGEKQSVTSNNKTPQKRQRFVDLDNKTID